MKSKLLIGILLFGLLFHDANLVKAQSGDAYELVRSGLNSGQVSQGDQYLLIASIDSNSAAEMNGAEFALVDEAFSDTRQQIHLPVLLR